MKGLILITLVFSSFRLWSQGSVAPIDDLRTYPNSAESYGLHPSLQPRIRAARLAPDSTSGPKANSGNENFFSFRLYPDLAAQYDTSLFYRVAAGFSAEGLYRNKLYFRASVASGWSSREGMNQTRTAFLPLHNRKEYVYTDVRARVAYTPNRMLHVAAGIDNQFFGEGARSLIQGNQVAPNPFAMMRVNVWRLEYGLLYQFFHENDLPLKRRDWKFGATHYLSYNATRNWNIALFETVLFQPKDGAFNRTFEVEYLNPIVFFRPQEYSLGSSDNVLLALQTSYRFERLTLYGQVSLDEFVLKEIRVRSRWWANKYGAQLGLKGNSRNGKIVYRFEGNMVRPYTYAHINSGQNYGNLGNALGHPLGSSFAEILGELQVERTDELLFRSYAVFQLQGLDEGTASWGGNIYQSYTKRPKEYGHTIGQGITVRTIRIGCEASYQLRTLKAKLYIDPQVACQWGDGQTRVIPAVTAGFRSDLFGPRRRF